MIDEKNHDQPIAKNEIMLAEIAADEFGVLMKQLTYDCEVFRV